MGELEVMTIDGRELVVEDHDPTRPPIRPEPPAALLAHPHLEHLPGTAGAGTDPYWRLVAAFLVGYPPHSSRAYFGDLKA
jgi:hypothetical protein